MTRRYGVKHTVRVSSRRVVIAVVVTVLSATLITLSACSEDNAGAMIAGDMEITAVGGMLSISKDWGVTPGKWEISGWDGTEVIVDFELVNKGEAKCFTIGDGYGSTLCLGADSVEVISWPYNGEDVQFTIKETRQGSIQSEVLCKIEANDE